MLVILVVVKCLIRTGKWITTGKAEPVLYIATEQSLDEVQTMMIAFLSGVNEEHIKWRIFCWRMGTCESCTIT